MENNSKRRLEIQLLASNYIESKRILSQIEKGIIPYDKNRFVTHRIIVDRIEETVEHLDEYDRFIIQKEVIEGKKGKWFLDYYSKPAYYRNRQKAYKEFLRCLG